MKVCGEGVHSGCAVELILHPADANSGICFLRTGLADGRKRLIEARWSQVSMTELCTAIGRVDGETVSTVEHLLAALAGLGVDNARIEINGPEVPIMDGSAAAFVAAIDKAGIVRLAASRRYLRVLKPVRIEQGRGFSELRPYEEGFRLDVEIDFDSSVIGRQRKVFELDAARFRSEISRCRTFGFMADVKRLRSAGLALGASLENSVAIDENRVLNPEGLRFRDEFVRHKMLDAIGDLALAGAPILGAYTSYCGGHKMNVAVLEALFSDRSAYAYVDATPRRESAVAAGRYVAAGVAYAGEIN